MVRTNKAYWVFDEKTGESIFHNGEGDVVATIPPAVLGKSRIVDIKKESTET